MICQRNVIGTLAENCNVQMKFCVLLYGVATKIWGTGDGSTFDTGSQKMKGVDIVGIKVRGKIGPEEFEIFLILQTFQVNRWKIYL